MGRPPQLTTASFYKPSIKPPVFVLPDSDQVFKELDSNIPDGVDLDLWKRLCAVRLKFYYIVLIYVYATLYRCCIFPIYYNG